jgi:periplasmic protein TonB
MTTKRIALGAGMVALVLSAGLVAQDVRDDMGPVERRARPITPENPVPRRTHSIAPAYPAEAAAIDATAAITLRVALDETGRIAEVRRLANPPRISVPPTTPPNEVAQRSAADAMVRSAAAALSQWVYDPPASGPIAFNVAFFFRPGAETTMTQDVGQSAGGGVRAGGPGLVLSGLPADAPPGAVRVGGNVKAPTRVTNVAPVYPPIAQSARVQGVVILEAVIGIDGKVASTRVLRSIPLLDQAAIDAVKQWEYTPTLLNGVAVPVIMTTTVQFTLPSPPPSQNQ